MNREEYVRRRICLVGAALAACSLTAGLAIASAAGANTVKASKKPVTFTVTCKTTVTTALPAGETQYTPPIQQGTDYGSVTCSGTRLRSGVQWDTWTIPDSGDTVGRFRQYFNAGTVHGTFDLTPGESAPPTQDNLAATNYTGTVSVLSGTGVYWGITGHGTSVCASPDDIHLSCTVKLKLKLPASTGK